MNYVAPTPTITAVQSYGFCIRNILFDAVSELPFFAPFTKRKSKQFQVQANALPYLGVYRIDESHTPDGDYNAGDVRFIHALRIGFSVIVMNNDPVAIDAKLDQAHWAIMNRLWPDQWIMNLLDTQAYGHPTHVINPDNVRIEGIQRGTMRLVWGATGLNNEMPLGEMQYDVTCIYRTNWPPIIVDELRHVHLEAVPMATDGTTPPAEEVERVIAPFDLWVEDD